MEQSGSEKRFSAFIGNLPYNAVPSDIESLFEGLSLKAVNLVRDKETDKFRGYAYADFATEEDLNEALLRDKALVIDREVTVQLPKPKQPRSAYRTRDSSQQHQQQHQHVFSNELPKGPPYKAFVGNFAYDTTEEQLRVFLEGLVIKEIKLIQDKETGAPKGHAYVEFEDRESLELVLTANNTEFNGRNLKVHVATQTGRTESSFQDRRSHRNFTNNSTRSRATGGGGEEQQQEQQEGKDPFFRSYNNNNNKKKPQTPRTTEDLTSASKDMKVESEEPVQKIEKKDITIEPTNKSKPKKEDIFGTAKPRDEFAYQKRAEQVKPKDGEEKQPVQKVVTERRVSSKPSVQKDKKVPEKKPFEAKSGEKKETDESGFKTVTKRHVK